MQLAQLFQETRFGVLGDRLHVDGKDSWSESRQEASFHQRRLAAARSPIEQADREWTGPVRLFDTGFPKSNALRQIIAIARAGQQLEKEVGIAGVKRAQT